MSLITLTFTENAYTSLYALPKCAALKSKDTLECSALPGKFQKCTIFSKADPQVTAFYVKYNNDSANMAFVFLEYVGFFSRQVKTRLVSHNGLKINLIEQEIQDFTSTKDNSAVQNFPEDRVFQIHDISIRDDESK